MIKPWMYKGASGASGLERSLRFRASANPYLSRTLGASGNQRTWTFSAWIKASNAGVAQGIFECTNGTTGTGGIFLTVAGGGAGTLGFTDNVLGITACTTTALRDPTGWYHILVAFDSTQATAANRVKFYINGAAPAMDGASTYPALNAQGYVNYQSAGFSHYIGNHVAANIFDGCMADVHFVDGQALDATSFAANDSNGILMPKAYAGTYGTNGFHLDFRDQAVTAGSNAGFGKDVSGNANYWPTTNISATAGVTFDGMYDYPQNAAAGTQPVGNYATLNPLIPSAANISYANLRSGTTAVQSDMDAAGVAGGAYWEVTAAGSAATAGLISATGTTNTTSVTANKVFGFRLTDAGALDYRNVTDAGAWTSITTGLTGQRFPYGVTQAADWNFGQRPFIGTASGNALCTANLANTTIITGGNFTGNAATDGPFVFLNGTPTTMTIDGNAVTWGTHADKLANGFKLRSAAAGYNDAGTRTYAVTVTDKPFAQNNRAQVNP